MTSMFTVWVGGRDTANCVVCNYCNPGGWGVRHSSQSPAAAQPAAQSCLGLDSSLNLLSSRSRKNEPLVCGLWVHGSLPSRGGLLLPDVRTGGLGEQGETATMPILSVAV